MFIKINLMAPIGAQIINYYGEEGVFIPLRYNAEKSGSTVWLDANVRISRDKFTKNSHEGIQIVPEKDRDSLVRGMSTFGRLRPVVYIYRPDILPFGKKWPKAEHDRRYNNVAVQDGGGEGTAPPLTDEEIDNLLK